MSPSNDNLEAGDDPKMTPGDMQVVLQYIKHTIGTPEINWESIRAENEYKNIKVAKDRWYQVRTKVFGKTAKGAASKNKKNALFKKTATGRVVKRVTKTAAATTDTETASEDVQDELDESMAEEAGDEMSNTIRRTTPSTPMEDDRETARMASKHGRDIEDESVSAEDGAESINGDTSKDD